MPIEVQPVTPAVCVLLLSGNMLTGRRSAQVRDWSLITGRVGVRGATKREGGHVKFYPYEGGGGGGGVLAMLKDGHKKFLGSFDAVA